MALTWTAYGAPAFATLRRVVGEAKSGDLLRPVTVLAPTNLAGVAARRSLAAGIGDRPGVAGLMVTTVDRLAEKLAAAALVGSGRRPATGAVLAAAWRRALDEAPGTFGPVATHPSTVRALASAHRELREVDEAGLAAVAEGAGSVGADLIRLHRRVVELVRGGWYDLVDLRRAAGAALREGGGAVGELGTVVLFLPQQLSATARDLLDQLAERTDVHTVAAVVGEERADAEVVASVRADAERVAGAATAGRVMHACDADDEVRCLVRELVSTLRETPAHRIAVFYGAARPYARILGEQLDAAGIRWNGTSVRPTVERSLARVLVDLLALPDGGWRRDEVMAVVAAAPVLDAAGQRIPASRWERISRLAGVVAGDDWDIRLKAYAAQERGWAAAERGCDGPRLELIARREADADAAEELRRFATGLQDRLHEGESLTTWPALSQWSLRLYTALIGDVEDAPWLAEDERRAVDAARRSLTGLAGLASVSDTADLATLRTMLDLDLAADLPRHGRLGHGVLVGPLSSAVGVDADVVFVAGLAEDLVPGRPGADPLLPDRVRDLAGGQLPTLRQQLDRRHRHLLAAFAAAPRVVASFPRGDLRRSSTRLPSRWLLPTLRRLAGDPAVEATRWAHVCAGVVDGAASFAAGLSGAGIPATHQEWRTRSVLAAQDLPDPALESALAMRDGRRADRLTRYDGDLSTVDVPDPTAGAVVSPTALEAWVRCPHGYFLSRLLRITPVQAPEEIVQISPLDVGVLVHTALDRFFAAQDGAHAVPEPSQRWSDAQRAALRRTVTEAAAELATRGVTGHPLLWRRELARVLADLDGFLDDDDALRAATGRRQVRSELAFGTGDTAPVEIALPDGRVVRMRGSADRVDRVGGSVVVVDYKTGGAKSFSGVGPADPTAGGAKLQLPAYGHAARVALGLPHADVSAEYWFLRKDRGRISVTLDSDAERRYATTIAVIADGIANGLFPHRPPADDGWGGHIECSYCDPDGLGVNEHRARWERKRHDPRLSAYLTLVDPDAARTGTPA